MGKRRGIGVIVGIKSCKKKACNSKGFCEGIDGVWEVVWELE